MSIDSTRCNQLPTALDIPGLQLQGASVQALQSTSPASHCQRESTARPSQTKPEAREQQYHGANFATTFRHASARALRTSTAQAKNSE